MTKPLYIGDVYIQLQMYTLTHLSKNNKKYFLSSLVVSVLLFSAVELAMEMNPSFAQEYLCSGSGCSIKAFNPGGQTIYYSPDSIPNYFAINK
jgi:hypothetical protein